MLGVGFEPRTLCLEHELPAPSTLGCGLHTLLSHSRSLLQTLQNCPRPLSWAFSADRGPLPGVGIKGCPCASPTPGAELSVRPPSCWPPRGGGCLSHPLSSSACLMPSFPSPEPPSLPLFLVSPTCLNRPPHPPPIESSPSLMELPVSSSTHSSGLGSTPRVQRPRTGEGSCEGKGLLRSQRAQVPILSCVREGTGRHRAGFLAGPQL